MKRMIRLLFSALMIFTISCSSISCSKVGLLKRQERDFLSLKEKGITALNEKRLEEGIQALESALKLKADNELQLILDYAIKEQMDARFLVFKEQGLKAVNEDRLSEGIKALEEALKITADLEISRVLDEAYYERGEYFYSIGKKEEALADIVKCSAENPKARAFLGKFYYLGNLFLASPQNQAKLESKEVSFAWNTVPEAIAYEIQVEDQNWTTVYLQLNTGSSLTLAQGLEFDNVYYWRVRAHFPNNIIGDWSKKYWFSIRKPDLNSTTSSADTATDIASTSTPPVLMDPQDKAKLDTYTFFFIWNAVEKADSYQIQIEDDKAKLAVSRMVKNTQYRTVDELKEDGTYYWQVRAHFQDNSFSPWSEKRSFSVHDESFSRFKAKIEELVSTSKGEIISIAPLYEADDWSKIKVVVGSHWQTLTKETKIDFAEYNNQLINTIAQYFDINDGSVLVVFYDESGQRVAELSSWGGYNILK